MKSTALLTKFLAGFTTCSVLLIASCNNDGNSDANSADTSSMEKKDTGRMVMEEPTSTPKVNHAEAAISGTKSDTTVSGTAKFDADSNGKVDLVLEITVPKMAGKSVAVHLHEHGDCGDNGTMAHGHWNPTNAQHGKWGSGSFHLGDIGNVKLDGKGKGTIKVSTDLWSLGGDANKNVIGRAVIVHSGEDDFTTQPTGNAGSRIGCGVIQ